MPTREDVERQYEQASERERELWAKVRGKYPGQPGHDPEQWQQWMEASRLVQTLFQLLKSGSS